MGGAAFVATGILLSRLSGLVRQRVFSHYFGLRNDAADAFTAALRIPNLLQNLFGEGALSGSFIPVYASLLARGDRREADRVAGAVAALLALVVAVLVLIGVAATPILTAAIAPGFHGEKRELTIRIVRVLFPGVGLLVMSAWCLGVLNSHRRFLLSYASSVMWNAAMIATLLTFGARADLPDRLRAALGDGPMARIAANELAMLGLAFFSWRSRPEPGTLSVHRRSGWTAVFVAVLFMSAPETAGLHFLIARWSAQAAWAATSRANSTRMPSRFATSRVASG